MRRPLRTRWRSITAISGAAGSAGEGRAASVRVDADDALRIRSVMSPSRSPTRTKPRSCERASTPRTSAGPSAPSALDGPIGSVRHSRPPERSAHDAWLIASSTSSASQPPGCSRAMTSSEAVSMSSTSTEDRTPVRSSPPARSRWPGPAGQRRAAAGLVDDDGTAPAVPDAHDRCERAERRPAAMPSAHRGPSRRAKALASSASSASASTSDARIQSEVGRAQRDGGPPRGECPLHAAAGPGPPRARLAGVSLLRLGVGRLGRRVRRGQCLQAADVRSPRPDRSGGRTADRSRAAYVGSARRCSAATSACSSPGARAGRRRHDAPARRRCRPRGQHGEPVAVPEQSVLRRGGAAVGEGQHVVVGEQRGEPVGRDIPAVDLDAVRSRGSSGEGLHGLACLPPHLTGHGEGRAGHLGEGPEEQVDALVLADDPERQSRVGPLCSGRSTGAPPGRCGGRSATETRSAPRSWASRAWAAECTSTESTRPSSARMRALSPGRVSCGRTLCAMTTDRGPPPTPSAPPPADARGAQQREVRGDDGR